MPKQLITLIGVLVSVAVIAVGVFVVALPLYLESLTTAATTYSVSQTNARYQQQIDGLQEQDERSEEIAASVGALRAQIPASNQFDDVFEVIANAAGSTGVTVTSITAGDPAAFVARTSPAVVGADPSATTPPVETPDPAATEVPSTTAAGEGADATSTQPPAGRTQSTFTILVTAPDINAVTAFLDALRSGPRMLQPAIATVLSTGVGIDVQVDATTFMDAEG